MKATRGRGSAAVRLGGAGSRMELRRGNCSRLPLPGRRPSMSPGSCVMASPRMALSAPPRSGSQPRVGVTPEA
eukprot:5181026-Alexandrium_andersonii.AAC.1